MSDTVLDVSASLVAKSDQLNAADLSGGPIVVRIEAIRRGTGQADPEKQPYELVISGGHKPWRPCKTMLRLLAHLWGTNGAKWTGHWIRLVNDPDVTFGKDATGGIRLTGADIPKAVAKPLPMRRGQYKTYKVDAIEAPPMGSAWVEPIAPPKPAEIPSAVAAVHEVLKARLPIVQPPLTKEEKSALMVHFGDCSGTAAILTAHTDEAFTAAILTGCGRTPKPVAD